MLARNCSYFLGYQIAKDCYQIVTFTLKVAAALVGAVGAVHVAFVRIEARQ